MRNIDAVIIEKLYNHIKNQNLDTNKPEYKSIENLTNKALAVLQEAGIFSMSMLLEYQKKKSKASSMFILTFVRQLIEANMDIFGIQKSNKEDAYMAIIEYVEQISKDIYKTMFLTNIIYQGLVYLRYHLKSK